MDHVEEADALAVVRDDEDIAISTGAMDPKNWRLHGPPVNREGGSSHSQPPVRRIPLPPPALASDSEGRYQCTKCPKRFPTPQSLGGHMSFHVKAKRVAEAQQRVEAPPVDNITAPTIAPPPLAAAAIDLSIAPPPLAAAAIDLSIAPPPLAAAAIDLSIALAPLAAAAVPVVPPAAPNGVPRDLDLNVEIPWE